MPSVCLPAPRWNHEAIGQTPLSIVTVDFPTSNTEFVSLRHQTIVFSVSLLIDWLIFINCVTNVHAKQFQDTEYNEQLNTYMKK